MKNPNPKSKAIKKRIDKAKKKLKDNRPDCSDLKGRPREYEEALDAVVFGYALLGLTDRQISGIIGVSEQVFNIWKHKYPNFYESLRSGRAGADAKVSKALYDRAIGFTHDEEKVFCSEGQIVTHNSLKQYPPDTNAAKFWLMNRQSKLWREKVEHSVRTISNISDLSDEELEDLIKDCAQERDDR